MGMRVGIPRALGYFKYGVLWKAFFEELGCTCVLSPESTRAMVDEGIKHAVDESCLPLKIYLGHVAYLKDKCDYLLVPRIVSLHKGESTCTKFMALYDIINNTFDGIKIIDYTVDMENNKFESFGFLKMGLNFTKNPIKILRAYKNAKKAQLLHDEKKAVEFKELPVDKNPKILIVSHPYLIRDSYFGKPIIDFLKSQGVHVMFADAAEKKPAQKLSKNISKDLYWTYNKELIGAIEMHRKSLHGIIYLVAFPCGPDALVVDMCRKKIKDIPSISLIIDELQGQVGLITRLESFLDILNLRRKALES